MWRIALLLAAVALVFGTSDTDDEDDDDEWLAILEQALPPSLYAAVPGRGLVRHLRIGRYHLYVLHATDGAQLHAALDAHELHVLTRNHAVTIPELDGPHHRQKRWLREQDGAAQIQAQLWAGTTCRRNSDAIGRRGYSQGGFSWGVDRIDQPEARYDSSFCSDWTGAGTHAYILDTGIAPHNTFLQPVQQDFSWFTSDGRPTGDPHGHGTHVAGLIASAIYGVAPGTTVHAIQVLDKDGRGSFASIAAGALYMLEHGERNAEANMSLGGTSSSTSVALFIDRLVAERNVVVVASAGNSDADACNFFPAQLDSVVTVGATDATDGLALFSNHGRCVDLSAPGVDIVSCARDGRGAVVLSGTSMSAPIVTGALALLREELGSGASVATLRAELQRRAIARVRTDTADAAPVTVKAAADTTRLLLQVHTDSAPGAPGAPAAAPRLSPLAIATVLVATALFVYPS